MRLPHFATRPMATLTALSLVLAACGDSTAPDAPFDPAGTNADLAVMNGAFESPAIASYNAVMDDLTAAMGGAPMTGAAAGLVSPGALTSRAGATLFAKRMTARFKSAATKPNFAESGIPPEYAGKTFEYDPETEAYGPTSRPGAPSNGVRFILYAVNPITGVPTDPLTEIGYAQLTITENGTAATAHLTVVSDGVTYFDYRLILAVTSSALTISVDGYVTNGTHQANFDLSFQVTDGGSGGRGTLDYVLEVPTRGFRLATRLVYLAASATTTVAFEARGPHGRVSLNGTLSDEGEGTLQVRVNGELVATIVIEGVTITITGADGHELTEDEYDTLQEVFESFDEGAFFFDALVTPTGLF